VRRALLGIVIMGTIGALILSLVRGEVVLLLFGSAFRTAADATAYQCWYAVLFALLAMIGATLAARDRQKQLAWLASAYALVATPILWIGAGFGATGLAIAALLSAGLNLVYHWVALQRSLPQALALHFTLRLLLILGSGIGLAWIIPQTWIWQLRAIACLTASVIYVVTLVLHSGPRLRGIRLVAST
jgi:O-antigen/teichoic acid export membrane protein